MTKENSKDLNSPEKVRERVKNNLILQITKEIGFSRGNPRIQLFVAHGYLEMLMDVLIKANVKNHKKILTDNRSYPYSSKILILNEVGVLSDEDYKLYDWLRKMRNDAAHEPFFELKPEYFQKLKPIKFRQVDQFEAILTDLMLRLWNANMEAIIPVFAPNMLK